MSDDSVTLSAELTKLKKNELIDIILFKRIPVNFSSSAALHKYLINNCECKKKCSETQKHEEQLETISIKEDREGVDTGTSEVLLLKRLTYHLEKRVKEQEQLIELIKENKNLVKSTVPSNNDINKSPIGKVEELQATKNSKQTQRVSRSEQENKNNTGAKESEWIKVNNKYKKKPVIGNVKSNIKTITKRGYLHVYRLDSSTTVEDMLNHLKITAPEISFNCDVLKKVKIVYRLKYLFRFSMCRKCMNRDCGRQERQYVDLDFRDKIFRTK